MIAPEIEKAARDAGFEFRDDASNSDRVFFRHGRHTILLNADATWSCYRSAGEIARTIVRSGYTLDGLLDFLAELAGLPCTKSESRPLRVEDGALTESVSYKLCGRAEAAKGSEQISAALDDLTEYLTWLRCATEIALAADRLEIRL